MNPQALTIAKQFDVPGEVQACSPLGSGHINDTFVVTFRQGAVARHMLLQRINHAIFKDVAGLMSNVSVVCDHVRKRLEQQGVSDLDRRALTLIPTREQTLVVEDERGQFWRMYRLIENAISYDIVETPAQAYAAGHAFGGFQNLLSDLPAKQLVETIVNFHHTPKRFAAFEQAVETDSHHRASIAAREIEWLVSQRALTTALIDLHEQGYAPKRITHNDTKLNNVLFDRDTQQALCVIDLDTVMPGLSLYDFGDLVRTATSPAAEDEPDVSKVTMRLPMFEALVRGYLEAAGDFLSPQEIEHLDTAGQVITLTMALRFLTDFLQGDVYYKTQHPQHNLERCRTQIALIESMQAQSDAMRRCIVAWLNRSTTARRTRRRGSSR